jgi:hypothetical protein
MCLWLSYKEKNVEKFFCFVAKLLKKEVGSGVGPGSGFISQRYGSPDTGSGSASKSHGSPTMEGT